MAMAIETKNVQEEEHRASNADAKNNGPKAVSSNTCNLPEPGTEVEHKQAVKRVFRKNAELFRRLA